MMKRAGKILWLIIIIMALSGIEIVLIRTFAGEKPKVEVYVAAEDIKNNQIISKEMIILKSFPVDCIPEYVLRGKSLIEGKSALINIKKGEIVSPSSISDKIKAPILDKNKVLYAIRPEPEDALAWQVDKGDVVTILGVTKSSDQHDEGKTIQIDNVIVSAIVDTAFNMDEIDPRYVILEVSIKQAKQIADFSMNGKLMILRQC